LGKRLLNLEAIQEAHCDYTTGTSKQFRVLRNIGEVAPYFPINEPILCFGSGDGFEVRVWELLGYAAIGCELSSKKREVALSYGVETVSNLEACIGMRRNVYCAHTIEHVEDRDITMLRLASISISTICFIFPIEPNGSMNPSHLSPIESLDDVDILDMRTALKYERWNDEREGIVIFKGD